MATVLAMQFWSNLRVIGRPRNGLRQRAGRQWGHIPYRCPNTVRIDSPDGSISPHNAASTIRAPSLSCPAARPHWPGGSRPVSGGFGASRTWEFRAHKLRGEPPIRTHPRCSEPAISPRCAGFVCCPHVGAGALEVAGLRGTIPALRGFGPGLPERSRRPRRHSPRGSCSLPT